MCVSFLAVRCCMFVSYYDRCFVHGRKGNIILLYKVAYLSGERARAGCARAALYIMSCYLAFYFHF